MMQAQSQARRPDAQLVSCDSPDCFNFFPPVVRKGKPKRFCSGACAGATHLRANNSEYARRSGDKRRGRNPNRHIRIRVEGREKLLHRHLVEEQTGASLDPDAIVHHRDNDKHHNCFLKNPCAKCRERGEPNLEVLTGEARREHIKYHQRQLQRARRRAR